MTRVARRLFTILVCLSLLILPAMAEETVTTITLAGDHAECASSSVLVDGSVVRISFPGVYALSGSLENGQIIVDCAAEGKVTLTLNGVSIRCEDGPAILIGKVSPRVSIRLVAGTVNEISTGNNFVLTDGDEPNGAIFSRSDLTITDAGTLNVTAGYMDGIVSKDDLRIKGGILNITAPRNGIRGKDYVLIEDGVIDISAGNDGIKSTNDKDPDRGYVEISGGAIRITCADDPISAVTRLTVTGGSIDATIAVID